MGSSPDMVNYKGEVLTKEMKEYLYGDPGSSSSLEAGGKAIAFGRPGKDPSVSKARADEILQNWLTGIRPTTIDPVTRFAEASTLSPLKDRAAAGMGIGGLFGFGKSLGGDSALEPLKPLNQSPMATGVPYTVPPLPQFSGLKGKG